MEKLIKDIKRTFENHTTEGNSMIMFTYNGNDYMLKHKDEKVIERVIKADTNGGFSWETNILYDEEGKYTGIERNSIIDVTTLNDLSLEGFLRQI